MPAKLNAGDLSAARRGPLNNNNRRRTTTVVIGGPPSTSPQPLLKPSRRYVANFSRIATFVCQKACAFGIMGALAPLQQLKDAIGL